MNRFEAIRLVIINVAGDGLMVHANGAMSRESFFSARTTPNSLPSWLNGLSLFSGPGLSLHHPRRRILVLDGDGNILVGMGNLVLIGVLKPENRIHLVLDNEAYEGGVITNDFL